MLNEGSLEVRNQVKEAVQLLKNQYQSRTGFNRILIKSNLNERQIDQIWKAIDQKEKKPLKSAYIQEKEDKIQQYNKINEQM